MFSKTITRSSVNDDEVIDRRKNVILGHLLQSQSQDHFSLLHNNNNNNAITSSSSLSSTSPLNTFSNDDDDDDSASSSSSSSSLLEHYGTSANFHGRDEIVAYHPDALVRGVALLKICNPPVNALSFEALDSLRRAVERCHQDPRCKAFVICSEIGGFFVAGADIGRIQQMQNQAQQQTTEGGENSFHDFIDRANDLLNLIESGPKPSVVAIDGTALGGGCELAMACNARVCTPRSNIGLPELRLGLIPGFGGSQRLPRLVGVKKAVEMMLRSSSVRGNEAHSIGLVDEIVQSDNGQETLLQRASQIALEMAQFQRPRKVSMVYNGALESEGEIQQILAAAESQVKKTTPHLPHPFACLRATRAGVEHNGFYGLDIEKSEFIKVATTPTARALVHFFFASRATSKIPRASKSLNKPRTISNIGVLGGGTMGSGIVIACLEAGMNVILKEVNERFLDAAVQRIRGVFQSRVNRGKLTKEKMDRYMSQLTPQIDYSGFDKLDMVIEAVLEIADLKQKVFQELEQVCNSSCILATNTSTIDVNLIGSKTRAQRRIIGLHFFSPAHIMQLLEIIRTDSIDQQVLADVLGFAKQIRKTPVVVGNCPGFVVNRVFFPYGQAAHLLVDFGLDPYRVDEVVKKFGMPMGPFRMNDLAGGDILSHAYGTMAAAFRKFTYPTHLNSLLVEAGRLGEKTGKGVYKHEKGRAMPDPDLYQFIAKARQMAGNPSPLHLTDEQIIEYVFFPAINEACRVIEENMVYRVSDIDIATILGMGFPVWRGGLVKWADMIGARKIHDRLLEMQKETGSRLFQPCNYLRECAHAGRSLFDAKNLNY